MEYSKGDFIKYRVGRSKETVEEAKLLMENNKLFAAQNRIYYAIFYIVSALASKDGFSTSKHHQLLGWFNKNYIKTGKLSQEIGEIYKNQFVYRTDSDYNDFIKLKIEDVQANFDNMIIFINTLEKLFLET
ncbi:MAG: HEPN domain-containing protein [Ignavibacteriales bacterium]|nr:HEPN domain-containing protein [Ignavibacteriales bacterium]